MSKHIFNRSIQFGTSRKALVAMAICATFPAIAMAGPSVGIGYTDIGLSGHAGRPGVTVTAGNLYKNDVVASGSATFARGFYGMNADLGKMIPTKGTVSFEPYVSLGFLNLNYQQQKTGYTTTTSSSFGYSFTQTTPYSYAQPASITDFYGLAGVNLNVPIGSKVALLFGGGYGHTITSFGGSGGAIYKGEAKAAFEVAHNVTANINVSYLHVPGASLTSEGAGLAYHFS
jgi:hypothetical protein